MSTFFREQHLFSFLESTSPDGLPLDIALNNYFRSHKALGPKDRKMIAEAVYGMTRWKGLLDHFCHGVPTWEKRYDLFVRLPELIHSKEKEIPPHIRCSFPKILFDLLAGHYGEERATELCLIANTPAPTTVRANLLKTAREALLQKWTGLYEVRACSHSATGIVFEKRINLFGLPEFKAGLFEVQDEASQLVAQLVQAKPGEQVMDYCAGSGGKTLAFGVAMQNQGQIHLHDVRPAILLEARKRLKRAGMQNAQTVLADDPKLAKLKKKMDWVLADVPCSGSGTLRRNPDMKWKFESAMLERLCGQQRHIFEKALSFLAPDGRIVYATCSIFPDENERQIAHFQRVYGLTLDGEPFSSFPHEGGMDGFFGAVLKR